MTQPADPPRATVLVVDDERGPRESLRLILSPAHQVLTAANAADAIEILQSRPVDLVTLDLNMPGVRGQELMRTIRQDWPTVEVIIITGHGEMGSATDGIRHGISDYLSKPFEVAQLNASIYRAIGRRDSRARLLAFLDALGNLVGHDTDAFSVLAEVESNTALRSQLGEALAKSARGVLPSHPTTPERALPFFEVLAESIESQDGFMRGHARRVAFFSGRLGGAIGLSEFACRELRIASYLHDIGKIGVPADLLSRPGALDTTEIKVVAEHANVGARLLEPLGVGEALVAAVRHHHERWDGRGYPDGLHGESVPLAARIIHIADAFEAMTCDRPYRDALAKADAIGELRRCAGEQFDPTLVKEFLVLHETGALDVDLGVVADIVNEVDSDGSESAGPSTP